jgi:hypothetical protein
LGVVSEVVRQKLEGNEAAKFQVFGLIDHTHPATAQAL